MIIPEFKYLQPSTLTEFLEIRNELRRRAVILAGGTDVIVNMKKGVIKPEHLISLKGIKDPALGSVSLKNGMVYIGACVTADELSCEESMKGAMEAVSEGAASLGSPLIRNRATAGGNIINARPAAKPGLKSFKQMTIVDCQFFRFEQTRFHLFQVFRNHGPETHLTQDIFFQVYSRGYLDQPESVIL